MTMLHTNTADAFTPEDYGKAVNLAVEAQSVAARSATVVSTDKKTINFPIWNADPAVAFYNENDLIAETDGATDEVEVTPTKTAGLTPISNELAMDSTPAAVGLISAGLSNQITRAIDGAYLGNTTAKGPNGLLSIASTGVETGAALSNLDPFIAARYAAKKKGSDLTSWIMHPDQAEAVLKLKKLTTGSNESLVTFTDGELRIAGLPVIESDQVDAATKFWGIPDAHVVLVMRLDTRVEMFPNIQRDGQWIRAVSRLGLGFLNPAGVVRGYKIA